MANGFVETVYGEYYYESAKLYFCNNGETDAVHDAQELTNKFPKNVLDLTGSMSYLETYSIMKRCNLYCGNDSGGIHIAVAAGLSCIEISCHPLTGSSSHSNAQNDSLRMV